MTIQEAIKLVQKYPTLLAAPINLWSRGNGIMVRNGKLYFKSQSDAVSDYLWQPKLIDITEDWTVFEPKEII